MITVEEYAELCARMAAANSDEHKELAVASAFGVSPQDWRSAKAHYTKRMSDPLDLAGTALAFIPAYQAAKARVTSDEPCPLESYTRVLAELADHGCDLANPRATGFNEVLAEHGFSRAAWRAAEGYWSSKLTDTSPQFSPGQATRFRVLMANEQRRRAM